MFVMVPRVPGRQAATVSFVTRLQHAGHFLFSATRLLAEPVSSFGLLAPFEVGGIRISSTRL